LIFAKYDFMWYEVTVMSWKIQVPAWTDLSISKPLIQIYH
jgi:hypothetical protein